MGNNKKKKTILFVAILGIIIVTMTVSFAFFTYSRTGSELIIQTGKLEFAMIDGTSVLLTEKFPQSDEDGNKNEAYKFEVRNTSTEGVTLYYNVSLVSNNNDESKNYFTNDQIKYSLVKNDAYVVGGATKGNLVSTVITEGSKEGVSLTNQTITAEKTDFYELRIWIDESVNYSAEPDSNGLSTGVYNGYEYSLKVKVDAQNSTTESEESTSMVKNDGYNNYTINYGASDDNYFMATSTGTVNATNLQECGSGEYPGECTDVTAKAKTGIVRMTDENTSTIKANVWYKTSENNIIVYFDNGGILKITVKNDSTFSNIDIYGINKLLTLMSCVGKWCDMDSDGSISLGDVITLGTERFYVLSTDNKNNAIKMLSMYNLYVGRMYTAWNSYTEILTTDDKYGKQDASAVATPSYNKYPTYASVPFSSDEIKGTNYSDYSGSIVEGYVNNYVNFLKEEIGVKDATGMLINTDDLAAIKGDNSVLIDSIMKWAPDWLYSTSYWIEDTASNKSILNISASGGIIGNSEYRNAANFGVRPVIVISADELN